jgi:hypothetical protein
MTEPITLTLTLEELKLIDKYVEYHDYDCDKPLLEKIRNAYPLQKSPVEEAYKDAYGYYPDMEHNMNSFSIFKKGYEASQPKPMDEVVNKLIREHQAQKLRNMLKVQLDYDGMVCDDIVDIVEDWLPKEQSAAGSQNVNTELLVEGFNDAIRKMKEMLR